MLPTGLIRVIMQWFQGICQSAARGGTAGAPQAEVQGGPCHDIPTKVVASAAISP